jgi:hypothetical protein
MSEDRKVYACPVSIYRQDGSMVSENGITFSSVYSDGHTGQSFHKQENTEWGFTCDQGVVALVRALNRNGVTTMGSCEDQGANFGRKWVIPRRWVTFRCENPHDLLKWCIDFTKKAAHISGWNLCIHVDAYHRKSTNDPIPVPFAELTVAINSEKELILAINTLGD